MNYVPESSLLNDIYVPFYIQPEFKTKKLIDFDTELDKNGVRSIIKFSKADLLINPFVDYSKFDQESKSWFWYDYIYDETYPSTITITLGIIPSVQIPNPFYPEFSMFKLLLGNTTDESSFYRKEMRNLKFDKVNKVMYFVSTTGDRTLSIKKWKYQYRPFIITINGNALTDLTDYANLTAAIDLSPTGSTNQEFYYDFNHKLYTNQNLDSFDIDSIEIHYYETIQEVTMKARLNSNAGRSSYYTPTIDYYITKLNGQYLQ